MKVSTLNAYDLQWALRRLPSKLLEIMKSKPNAIFIAGGFIRSIISHEPVNDIDVFTPTKEEGDILAMLLAEGDPKRLYRTENAITVKGYFTPIQIIHRWNFEKPEDCIASFDFTIAAAAIFHNGAGWQGLCDENFYADLASKRLVYRSPIRNEDAGGSMLRVLKFYQRGYRIPLGSLGAVIGRMVAAVPQEKFDNRKGMEGIEWEIRIGAVITGLLREVDPYIDPNHIAHISDLNGDVQS